MLEVIIILSWILQRYADLYIVLGLLIFNSILGFVEEQRASSSVDALKEKLRINARVLRDGVWKTIAARELVPGDVVRSRAGDFVPADEKLVTGNLEIDQSALTGESMVVEKKPSDVLYSGSVVKRGEANGVVVSTGVKTFLGRTTELVQLARPKLHMEEVVSSVVRWLLLFVVILIVAAFAVSAVKELNLLDVLPIILLLLLSAIPVALPAMFTVSMAIGSMELVKKGLLVTRLSASEDAATMTVLCADKTGTITMNRLSVMDVIPFDGFSEKDVVLCGALASQEANQDPIDIAFITKARQEKLLDASYVQISFSPFDPMTRKTEAVVRKSNAEFRVIKGAVNTITQMSEFDEHAMNSYETRMQELAAKGYRTLAVAKTDDENKIRLVGLTALYDTPRSDSAKLIQELRTLGVSVKMLTGDALPIAREVAEEVQIGNNLLKASDLKDIIKEDPVRAVQLAEKSDGFAEVFPEDKYTIVKSLQAARHIVGMTGDGVNDAPALRQAEVGIAVANATDVAKGAASVVLTTDGLTSVVGLIENGRVIFERITAWVLSKIIRTLQIAIFVVLAFLLTGTYIISAFALVLYFFLTDFVKISLSTDNLAWSKKPDTWNITGAVRASLILGSLVIAESFALLYLAINFFGVSVNSPALYTLTFEILFYSAMFLIFNVRERGHFWSSKPSRILLIAIVLSIVVGTLISTVGVPDFAPVPLYQTAFVMFLSAVFSLGVNDQVKFILVKNQKINW